MAQRSVLPVRQRAISHMSDKDIRAIPPHFIVRRIEKLLGYQPKARLDQQDEEDFRIVMEWARLNETPDPDNPAYSFADAQTRKIQVRDWIREFYRDHPDKLRKLSDYKKDIFGAYGIRDSDLWPQQGHGVYFDTRDPEHIVIDKIDEWIQEHPGKVQRPDLIRLESLIKKYVQYYYHKHNGGGHIFNARLRALVDMFGSDQLKTLVVHKIRVVMNKLEGFIPSKYNAMEYEDAREPPVDLTASPPESDSEETSPPHGGMIPGPRHPGGSPPRAIPPQPKKAPAIPGIPVPDFGNKKAPPMIPLPQPPKAPKKPPKTVGPKQPGGMQPKNLFGDGMAIQTVIFNRSKWTPSTAARWLRKHNYKVKKIDEKKNTFRFRQHDPAKFKSYSAEAMPDKGITLVYGYTNPQTGSGFFDTVKSAFRSVRSGITDRIQNFGSMRTNIPPKSRTVLEKYGNTPIKSAYVCRKALADILNKVIKLTTTIQYDKLYHLSINFILEDGTETEILAEKNEVINIEVNSSRRKDPSMECREVTGSTGKTLGDIMEKTKTRMGSSFATYQGVTNNCQVWIRNILDANGMKINETQGEDFILQNVTQNVSKTVSGIADKITNFANRINRLIHGSSVFGNGIDNKKWEKVYEFNQQTGKDYHWVGNGIDGLELQRLGYGIYGGATKNTIIASYSDLPHPTGTVAQQLYQNYTNPTKGSAADITNAIGDIASAVAGKTSVPGAGEAISYVFAGLGSAIQNYVNEGKVREAMGATGRAQNEALKALNEANISEQSKTSGKSIIYQMYHDRQGDVEDLKNRLSAVMLNDLDPGPNGSYTTTRQQFAALSPKDQEYVRLQANQATRMPDLTHMTAAQAAAAQRAYYQANPKVLGKGLDISELERQRNCN